MMVAPMNIVPMVTMPTMAAVAMTAATASAAKVLDEPALRTFSSARFMLLQLDQAQAGSTIRARMVGRGPVSYRGALASGRRDLLIGSRMSACHGICPWKCPLFCLPGCHTSCRRIRLCSLPACCIRCLSSLPVCHMQCRSIRLCSWPACCIGCLSSLPACCGFCLSSPEAVHEVAQLRKCPVHALFQLICTQAHAASEVKVDQVVHKAAQNLSLSPASLVAAWRPDTRLLQKLVDAGAAIAVDVWIRSACVPSLGHRFLED